jgi:hypothetical protein
MSLMGQTTVETSGLVGGYALKKSFRAAGLDDCCAAGAVIRFAELNACKRSFNVDGEPRAAASRRQSARSMLACNAHELLLPI